MAYARDVSYLGKIYAASRKEILTVINYTAESRLH
jgi:hypothetical protein